MEIYQRIIGLLVCKLIIIKKNTLNCMFKKNLVNLAYACAHYWV